MDRGSSVNPEGKLTIGRGLTIEQSPEGLLQARSPEFAESVSQIHSDLLAGNSALGIAGLDLAKARGLMPVE